MSQPLIHNSARVLEFDALRELLRGYSSSPLGQAKIRALAPSTDSAWIGEQQELTAEVREFRRVGGRFDFSGLLDITKLLEEVSNRGSCARNHGDSRRAAGGGPGRGVARDRASSSGKHEDGMAANRGRFRKACPTSRSSCDLSATRFSPMERWKTALPRAGADSPRDRKAEARAFRNRCADICGAWPRAAQCRTN